MTSCTVLFVGIERFTQAFSPCGDRFSGRNVTQCVRKSAQPPTIWGAGVASPDERRVPRLCHITCRACKRGSAPRRLADFPAHRRHELRQNGVGHQPRGQEKTRTVTASRHDTLCVRGIFSLFLLEQYFAAFGDSNPGGKTTLIVTINRYASYTDPRRDPASAQDRGESLRGTLCCATLET